jgi:alpha,alpha-trehalose-phosphate synthase [UDP-forming]
MWTKQGLQELIRTRLCNHRFIVVANREPYVHRYVNGRVECEPPASGMVSALEPIMRACGGAWIAHGSGNADRRVVDEHNCLLVPPENPVYKLRRIWLSKQQVDGYYNGLANQGLWPLCHQAFIRPVFDPRDWATYKEVNAIFAEAVLEEANGDPAFVFVQDYHFGLLPRLIKEQNPNLIVAQFWHIPWPTPMAFQAFPWREELLSGLLGNDLIGFHLRSHCSSFLETVDRTLEAKIDNELFEVNRGGRTTVVRPFPISIDFDAHAAQAATPTVETEMKRMRLRFDLTEMNLGLGIDRIDYTKGIPERLRAIDHFLDRYPEYRGRFVFIQVGVPSRTHIPEYKRLDVEIDNLVEEINWRWNSEYWKPIIYVKNQLGPVEMMALHRLADLCIVSSLDDGMNLVAKEFVASRTDELGVLVLSRFTGAARELSSAIQVNPFAVEESADAIAQALTMSDDERRRRMQRLRRAVADSNIYRWAGKLLSALLKFDFPEAFETAPGSAHVAELAGHLATASAR